MEPFLRSLVRLQELSLEVARLNGRISQIPEEIKVIDREETAASGAVSQAKQALEATQKKRKDFEGSLQDLEQKIVKYNDQSREVKTNDQYRAIMKEIDAGMKPILRAALVQGKAFWGKQANSKEAATAKDAKDRLGYWFLRCELERE